MELESELELEGQKEEGSGCSCVCLAQRVCPISAPSVGWLLAGKSVCHLQGMGALSVHVGTLPSLCGRSIAQFPSRFARNRMWVARSEAHSRSGRRTRNARLAADEQECALHKRQVWQSKTKQNKTKQSKTQSGFISPTLSTATIITQRTSLAHQQ